MIENEIRSTEIMLQRTSLSSLNLAHFFPWPASGTQISTRSCFVVSASRRSICATVVFKATDGSPVARPPAPRYLMTEFVW